MTSLLSWLRTTIECDKAIAEAASAGYGHGLAGSGQWTYTAGADAVHDAVLASPAVVGAACDCCATHSMGRAEDLEHIALHDPRDVIARCESELQELDVLESIPHMRVEGDEWFSCGQARDEDGKLSCHNEERIGQPCDCGRDAYVSRMLRIKASGYRHRSGFNPGWADDVTIGSARRATA